MITMHEVPDYDEHFWVQFELFLRKNNALEVDYSVGQFTRVESITYDHNGTEWVFVRFRDGTMEVGNDS